LSGKPDDNDIQVAANQPSSVQTLNQFTHRDNSDDTKRIQIPSRPGTLAETTVSPPLHEHLSDPKGVSLWLTEGIAKRRAV
jgi:hypothetical protein